MRILIVLNVLLFVILIGYIYYNETSKKKSAYIISQTVFEKFNGTKYLQDALRTAKESHKRSLDSIAAIIESRNNDASLIEQYNQIAKSYQLSDEQLSAKYTSDVWKAINSSIAEFGKKNNYQFIFGATGDGNLMYGDSLQNVTEEVGKYVNEKYDSQ